jgi:phospholipase C
MILSKKIAHIVVLMLENRSFDSMLGGLYPKSPDFEGLSGNETNPYQDHEEVGVWSEPKFDWDSMSIPDPDPGELWQDINTQLFGLNGQPGNQPPSMNGFVNNYISQKANPADPRQVMHYYAPSQVPVITQLARQFAVCDHWYASAPCQTWPNRFFVHTGTAHGYENNSPTHFPYWMDTIYNRLQATNQSWGIYFHDFPQSLTLSKLWDHIHHFHSMDDFKNQAASGQLPGYCFIEPRYFPDRQLPNDQHPPHHVGLGEQLIADIYNTLRQAPTWKKTLFIVTYDEHGGSYDHMPPPSAVPPDQNPSQPFAFDRYGVRVPTVIISPYIKPGTILRASLPYPFDHTSIIATVRKCFNLRDPLTRRDAVAPDLASCLNLENPENDGVDVHPLPYTTNTLELERARHAPMSDFQKVLHQAAAHLPSADIEQGGLLQTPPHVTPAEALPFIRRKVNSFLKR